MKINERAKLEKKKKSLVCYSKGHEYPSPFTSYSKDEHCFIYYNACECLDICKEKFLHLDSKGTREHRKANKTKFTGCQRNEDKLITENDIVPRVRELEDNLSKKQRDIITKQTYDYDILNLILERNRALDLGMNEAEAFEYFSLFKRPSQDDKQMLALSELLAMGHYRHKKEEVDFLFIALLMLIGLNDYDDLLKLFPRLNSFFYHSIRSKIYADIRKHIPAKVTHMERAMKTLSKKQSNAVTAYITHNEDSKSLQQIADTMGIERSSLYNRIQGAKVKIRKYFEENVPDWEKIIYLKT